MILESLFKLLIICKKFLIKNGTGPGEYLRLGLGQSKQYTDICHDNDYDDNDQHGI